MDEEDILKTLHNYYSQTIESVEFLREGGSTTYIVIDKEQKFLLKVVGRAFLDTIRQSIDIMCYLREHSFPVPRIIRTIDGQTYIMKLQNGIQYMFVLYEFIDGKEPEITENAEVIGALVGKLHLIMQQYEGELVVRGKPFFIDRYINILRSKGCSERELEQYITLGDRLWGFVQNLQSGYCHGDLHRGNLLQTRKGKIYVIDFDTSCLAPRMFDLMVMCDTTDYFKFNPHGIDSVTSIFNRFTKGYTKYIALSEAERKSIYDFIGIRHYQLQATIVEIYGLDCIDQTFIQEQLNWLIRWKCQCDL